MCQPNVDCTLFGAECEPTPLYVYSDVSLIIVNGVYSEVRVGSIVAAFSFSMCERVCVYHTRENLRGKVLLIEDVLTVFLMTNVWQFLSCSVDFDFSLQKQNL